MTNPTSDDIVAMDKLLDAVAAKALAAPFEPQWVIKRFWFFYIKRRGA